MTCNETRERFAAYLFGELPEPERGQVDCHLADCAECREHVEQMQMVAALLGEGLAQLPNETLTSERRRRVVAAAVAPSNPAPPFPFTMWGQALAIAAAFVILCAVLGGLILPKVRQSDGIALGKDKTSPPSATEAAEMPAEAQAEIAAEAESVGVYDDGGGAEAANAPSAAMTVPERPKVGPVFADVRDITRAKRDEVMDERTALTLDAAKMEDLEQTPMDTVRAPLAVWEAEKALPVPALLGASEPAAGRETMRRPSARTKPRAADSVVLTAKTKALEADMDGAAEGIAAPGEGPGGGRSLSVSRKSRNHPRPDVVSYTAGLPGGEGGATADALVAADPPPSSRSRQRRAIEPAIAATAIAADAAPPVMEAVAPLAPAEVTAVAEETVAGKLMFRDEPSKEAKKAEARVAVLPRAAVAGQAVGPRIPPALTPVTPRLPAIGLVQRVEEDAKQRELRPTRLSEQDQPSVFAAPPVNPFVMTEEDCFSTFAIDTDTASYSLARNYIRNGYLPPAQSVRMEEFVNTFDYNYSTRGANVFTVDSEAAPAPFGRDLVLLKVGIKARVIGRDGRKPAHVVMVVDTSGSMGKPDRLPLVQYAIRLLAGQLDTRDKFTLVTYNTRVSLDLECVPGSAREQILGRTQALRCMGSTNLAAGIRLGYEMARKGFVTGGINSLILCSDGVANVGPTVAEDLLELSASYRQQGITFTSVGFGMGNYNDVVLEQMANKGDGHYLFVDSQEEARRLFVDEMFARLQTVAKDAKIQVEFDPAQVRRYRLIGYENRNVADRDFRNDSIDAGEVGSGQSATALYELELLPAPEGAAPADLGAVHLRYRNTDTNDVEETSYRLHSSIVRNRPIEENPRFYLAACSAEFAEILRASEHVGDGSLPAVESLLAKVANQLPLDRSVQEFLSLVRRSQGLPRGQ